MQIMKKILFISPGPKMKIKNERSIILSKHYKGAILTTSSKKEIIDTKEVCGFEFRCMHYTYKHHYFSGIKFFMFCILFSIKARLDNNTFDLVTTYDPLKTGLIGYVCSRILRAKFAPEVAGTYTSKYNYIDESFIAGRLKHKIYPLIMRFLFKRADGIKYQYPSHLDNFKPLLENKILSYFPNLYNHGNFTNMPEEKVVLVVGFPFRRKGIDIAIEAFKLIAPNHPEWKLKILGWYPNKNLLESYIGGHPQIIYHPPVEPDEMPEQVGRCAILIVPSRSEGVPRILMEAMSAGKARIGTDIEGIPSIISVRLNLK